MRDTKRSKFSEEQIVYALREDENGRAVNEICRELGVSEATFHTWRKKYGQLGISEHKRLRLLEHECQKLQQLVADLTLDKQMLQDVLRKKV